jgi:hypothetical protein
MARGVAIGTLVLAAHALVGYAVLQSGPLLAKPHGEPVIWVQGRQDETVSRMDAARVAGSPLSETQVPQELAASDALAEAAATDRAIENRQISEVPATAASDAALLTIIAQPEAPLLAFVPSPAPKDILLPCEVTNTVDAVREVLDGCLRP